MWLYVYIISSIKANKVIDVFNGGDVSENEKIKLK